MRRRLDIAMSLIGDPEVVFLDEPTTGLDPQSRLTMWETIRRLADDGVTILLTTQYLEEADRLADRVAILNGGAIVASGTPRELKDLLPRGEIELRFGSNDELDRIEQVLAGQEVVRNSTDLSLTVRTGGGVGDAARLFTVIEESGIEPVEFSHKVPTLDDAFFEVTRKEAIA